MPTSPINVLQITTHDSGRHFGCYGHPTLHTPAIDRLANDGLRLTNCFCPVPICSPSRTSMLTGLYPQQHGQLDLTGFGWRLKDPALHICRRLGDAGYHTALFGTQHEVLPVELDSLGFDTAIPKRDGENALDVADQATTFLHSPQARQKPFYLQVGFRETHTPFAINGAQPDTEHGVEIPPYLADDQGNRDDMAAFQGAIRLVDQGVDHILRGLRDSGLEHNTLVVFTTDHGIEMVRAKWHVYDPGIAIAMIFRCPALGLTGGQTYDELCSNVDYLPTVFDWLNLPADHVEGQSFADSIYPKRDHTPRDAIFAMFAKRSHPRCIRTSRYKYIRHFESAAGNRPPVASGTEMAKSVRKPVELFDLQADPLEAENRVEWEDYQTIRYDLNARLWHWMESVNDPLLAGPIVSPSYQNAMRDYTNWKGR